MKISLAFSRSAMSFTKLQRKLDGLDTTNGLGVLHGLLVVSDDDVLFSQLLNLGIDPEVKFRDLGAVITPPSTVIPHDLDGGTAFHFAVYYDRPKCGEMLLRLGVRLDARTRSGKTPLEIIPAAAEE